MTEHEPASPATELVYVPGPSWTPLFIAAGVMILLFATFTWWVYGLVGIALLLPALVSWFRRSDNDVSRLPRRQRVTTAVLPAVPPKKPSGVS
jgi:hypothetical protein